MALLNKASDVSAGDCLPQTHMKNCGTFSDVEIQFFSAMEIPIKHCS